MAQSMSGQLSMFEPPSSESSPNAISSPALVDGPPRFDSRAGLMIGRFGPAPALVSLSRQQARAEGRTTRVTFGRSSVVSSASAALQSSLESRLSAMLAGSGSVLFSLTWKHWPIAQQAPICAVRASARSISDSDYGSWPTPNAGPQNDGDTTWQQRRVELKAKHGNGNGFGMTLGMAATLASWTTPRFKEDNDYQRKGDLVFLTLQGQAKLANWRTPNATDGDRGAQLPERRKGHTLNLRDQVLLSGPTASGSPAQTESGGQLNPAHSRWLMGYPVQWDYCAITALSKKK